MIDIDELAKAAAQESGVSNWAHVSEHGDYDSRDYWRRIVRAILTRLREPSEEMLDAACEADGGPRPNPEALIHWQAMLDAIAEQGR